MYDSHLYVEFKKPEWGTPGWLSGWASAFGSGRDPRVLGLSSASGSLQGARCGTRSQNPGITTWAKGRCSTTESPRCPSFIPFLMLFLYQVNLGSSPLSFSFPPKKVFEQFLQDRSSDNKFSWFLFVFNLLFFGDTWVAQWLSICLWLRSWSQGPGIEFCIRLPVGSLLLPLPVSLPLSFCVSHG